MADIKPLRLETYLAVIKNSVRAKSFSQGYAQVDGEQTDIMRGGELSCAFFVSSVLKIFDAIESMHATVGSTVRDLEKFGWKKVDSAEAGDVLVWEPIVFPSGESHEHIGFSVGNNRAISNDFIAGTPQEHDSLSTPDGSHRKIVAIYRGRHLFETPS